MAELRTDIKWTKATSHSIMSIVYHCALDTRELLDISNSIDELLAVKCPPRGGDESAV
jgi:hypothetical protein